MSSAEPRVIEKFSPVTGEKLGDYPMCTPEEVDEAVARARRAQPDWGALSVKERMKRLHAVRDVLGDEGEAFARRISRDTGKPYLEALLHEVIHGTLLIDHYDKLAPKVLGRRKVKTPVLFPGKQSYVDYFPMGVVAVISPWNFPFRLSIAPVLSALIAGNTVVLKPSEVTPETGEVLREVFQRANLGPGIVEVCQGDGAVGAALTRADIDMIFFTGSVDTGRLIMKQGAERPIPVELELGGKDAVIICHDADLERSARAVVWGALSNCGQQCTSIERVIVVESIHDRFVELMESAVKELTQGGPDEHADLGPVIFGPQLDIIAAHIADAVQKGARVLTGGRRVDREGQFFEPTLLDGITTDMDIWREETFGPVIPVIKVADEDEAVRYCNDHQYGLSGSVLCGDPKRGLEIASRMHSGQVMVNDVIQITGNVALPFGGVKNSGVGRYHGEEGLTAFAHQRAIMVDRGLFSREPYWFPYRRKYSDFRQLYDALIDGSLPRLVLHSTKLRKLSK